MKRLIYILSAITVLLISCTPEILPDTGMGDNCIKLTVNSSVMKTRSIDDPEGNTNERVIRRLDCFFYSKGDTDKNCILHKSVTGLNADAMAEIPIYVNEDLLNTIFPSQTTCDVYVIANLPDGISIPENTDTTTLGNILITSNEFSEAIKADHTLSSPSTFVMKGAGIAIRDAEDVTGNIPLHRVASKITFNVYLPEYIITAVNDTDGNFVGNEKWIPYFDNPADPTVGVSHVLAGFHNGTKKDYISGNYTIQDEDYYETPKTNRFTYKSTLPADPDKAGDVNKYLYKCEAEFYTYSSEWEQGDPEASYITLVIPWKKEGEDEYQTFYYQVLVNAGTRKFESNRWYDLTLIVGVLGSTVEAKPVEVTGMSYHILDWSTLENTSGVDDEHLNEDINIYEWQYLIVHKNRIEMNNTTVGEVNIDASHPIGWKLEWPGSTDGLDEMENYNSTTEYPAYYVNCGDNPPVSASLNAFINGNCFNESDKKFTFTYPKATIDQWNETHGNAQDYNIYSPVYVHIKVWLNIDRNNPDGPDPGTNEEKFVEYITFVYYPPMYIIPDESVRYSVYVNGQRKTATGDNVIKIEGNGNTEYDLGGAAGNDNSRVMHTITISSFAAGDTFSLKPLDNTEVTYIIGDPRVRTSDTNLNDDDFTNNGWAEGENASGGERKTLTHYYPTSTEGDSYRIVAPKFRVASKLGGYSAGDAEGTAMRCASYQEDGYPAGRWRLPTTAEILFIVKLQDLGVIQELFVGNEYFSATHQIDGDDATVSKKDNSDHSVRCVYDEWYWGSEKEAVKNPAANPAEGAEFLYTWGDKEITW